MQFICRLLIVFNVWGATICTAQTVSRTPNIVLIYVDDMGYGDLSCYGAEYPTPHIDGIAHRGVRFTDFYAASPVCTPSRFGLLTGMAPHRSLHGLTHALMPDDKGYLDQSETTIGSYMKQAGYRTALIGKWHLGMEEQGGMPDQYGFDVFTGSLGGCIDYFRHDYGSLGPDWFVKGEPRTEIGYSTDLLTDHAIDFIQECNNETQPFFLYLPYNAPHYGKTDSSAQDLFTLSLGTARYKGITDKNTLQVPESYLERVSYIKDPYRQTYAAMVTNLDDNIGRLLDQIAKLGILDDTMIWFISDNGGYSQSYEGHASNGNLRGQKAQLYEGGIRVPAMVMWPSGIQPQKANQTPVINMDILPTLISLVAPDNILLDSVELDGVDISPLWRGEGLKSRYLYWKYGKHTALRYTRWKLLDGVLYDLEADPLEHIDVSHKNKEVFTQMQETLFHIEKDKR